MNIRISKENRGWSYPEELGKEALVFWLEGKPGRIYLVKDKWYSNTWDIHFRDVSEFEIDSLIDTILLYINPGEYLATCGDTDEVWFSKFWCRTVYFRDTGMIRKAGNSYYPILKKL